MRIFENFLMLLAFICTCIMLCIIFSGESGVHQTLYYITSMLVWGIIGKSWVDKRS